MRLLRLFKKDLAREVSDWIDRGIVARDQGEKILARYGGSLADARGVSVGYWALTALAVLFAGLSLIVLVSANWDEIPRAVRMGGLVALTMLVNSVGVYLFVKGREKPAILCLFFGGISYGVSIMLIAQIYHLGEHYPDGVFHWALGVLPLVVLTKSRILALLTISLSTIWMFMEANEAFFPWLFPVFAIACGWLVVRERPSAMVFLASVAAMVTWMNLLVAWLAGGANSFDATDGQVPFSIAMALLLFGLSYWMMTKSEMLKDQGLVLSLWLMRGLLVFLVVFSFADIWKEFRSVSREDWWFLGTLPVLGGAGCYLASRAGRVEALTLLVLTGFFIIVFPVGFVGDATVAAILTNLMLLAAGIWFIRRGVSQGVTHYYYTGIGVLLVTAVCRYFDLIGDYVGASLMFLVAAGILFASARFWKKRSQEEGVRDAAE